MCPRVCACWRKCCTYPFCGGPSIEEPPLAPVTIGVLGLGWHHEEDPVVIERLPEMLSETVVLPPPPDTGSFQLSTLKLVCALHTSLSVMPSSLLFGELSSSIGEPSRAKSKLLNHFQKLA